MHNCQEEDLIDFISNIKKTSEPRKHKVKGSLGVYDSYKWIRKNKWLNIGRSLTEHEFYTIIRSVNNYLADNLALGKDVVLPNKMGRLELRKYDARFSIKNGKVKSNLPIDWDKTLKLWYDDEEAFNNKTLVKIEEKEIFKIYYNKHVADYTNQVFYEFIINRDIKKRLKHKIKEGKIDAFKL